MGDIGGVRTFERIGSKSLWLGESVGRGGPWMTTLKVRYASVVALATKVGPLKSLKIKSSALDE